MIVVELRPIFGIFSRIRSKGFYCICLISYVANVKIAVNSNAHLEGIPIFGQSGEERRIDTDDKAMPLQGQRGSEWTGTCVWNFR